MKSTITILGLFFILIISSNNISNANWKEKENNLTQVSNSVSVKNTSSTGYFISNSNVILDEEGNSIFRNSIPDTIIFAGEASFGVSVSSAGDVNGDGYTDIIIGEYGYNAETGRAFIYYGGTNMDTLADVILNGESSVNYFGHSVSTAGDVNGDGYSDVIVSAFGYNNNTGRIYIFLGGLYMNNVADLIITGDLQNSRYGYSISSAGDVNGDSYSDILVGTFNIGKAYLYFGGKYMNNVVDLIFNDNEGNYFGSSVSSAGDVNRDGFADVIIGAPSESGRSYIYYGGSAMNNTADVILSGEFFDSGFGKSVSSAGDVNGDGYVDVIIGSASASNPYAGRAFIFYGESSMNNIPDIIITPEMSTILLLGNYVSTVGDLNGDGYSDVAVSNQCWIQDSLYRTFIYYGDINMDNLSDISLAGSSFCDGFGNVSPLGDINGDSYSDVIIGAYGINRAYVFLSLGPKPILVYPAHNSLNNQLDINFVWKKYRSAIYYVLNVSTDIAFSHLVVNDTIFADTSKTINGLQKDTQYFWKVIAKDSSELLKNSSTWTFSTIPSIKISLKVLIEGMYFPIFNQMTRKDTVKVYLCSSVSPYNKIDSAIAQIDSLAFTGLFKFYYADPGTYYIVAKHFNSIETWSKSDGETLTNDGSTYNYDFTTSASQAYGSNLKRKGTKYCIYSGDINFDGVIDGSDALRVHSDSFIFLTGSYLSTDLNGDSVVDGSDYSIVDNNAFNFVVAISP